MQNFSQQLETVQAAIKQRGFTTIPGYAGASGNSVCLHTIGLTNKGWPEIIVTGALHDLVKSNFILWAVHIWRENGVATNGVISDFFKTQDGNGEVVSRSIKLVAISPQQSGMNQSPFMSAIYPECNYSAVQLLWPDSNGHLPDDPQYSTHPDDHQDRFRPLQ